MFCVNCVPVYTVRYTSHDNIALYTAKLMHAAADCLYRTNRSELFVFVASLLKPLSHYGCMQPACSRSVTGALRETYVQELFQQRQKPFISENTIILECFQLGKADLQSLDFSSNRLCVKLFKTGSIDVVKDCLSCFVIDLPSCVCKKGKISSYCVTQ